MLYGGPSVSGVFYLDVSEGGNLRVEAEEATGISSEPDDSLIVFEHAVGGRGVDFIFPVFLFPLAFPCGYQFVHA